METLFAHLIAGFAPSLDRVNIEAMGNRYISLPPGNLSAFGAEFIHSAAPKLACSEVCEINKEVIVPFVVAFIVIALIWVGISSIPVFIWYGLGAVIFIFVFILFFTDAGKEARRQERLDRENAERLKIERERLPADFAVSKSYRHDAGGKLVSGVAVDVRNKKIATYDFGKWDIHNWEDIISCEADITENNVIHTSSSRSLLGAAVGGLAFGPAGAIIGGLGGKTSSSSTVKIEKIVIRLGLRNVNKPTYEVQFGEYVTEQSKADFKEWVGRFNAILSENERAVRS